MKKYSRFVLYNIIVIILLFLLFEAAIRIFVPQITLTGTSSGLIVDSLYNDSPGIRSNVIGTSGGITKESNEYHSWKYFKPVSKNTYKLLFLGDSVTMGISVENDSTYAGKVNNDNDSLNVINTSLIGYSSKDYLNVFNYFIEKKEFNLNFSTVVLFWTLNDIYSNYPDSKSPEFSSTGLLSDVVNFFRRNSKAYHFLKNLFSDRSRAYYEYDKRFYDVYNPLLLGSIKNIEQISLSCDSLHIKFLLVLLPYEYQIRNFNQKEIFLPQWIIKEKLKKQVFEIIDLKEAFRNDSTNSYMFYLYGDGIHFNEKGNSVISEYLKKFL